MRKIGRLRTLVLSVLLLLPLSFSAPAQAAFPGGNGLVAFVRGDQTLWVMNQDGSDPRRIPVVPDAGTELLGVANPNWSADGKQLVVDLLYNCPFGPNCSNEVGLVDPGTGQARTLTCVDDATFGAAASCSHSEVGGTLSPDGTKVAYLDLSLVPQIFVLDLNSCTDSYQGDATCSKRRLTNDANNYGHPSWSPDGKWIAAQRFDGAQEDIVVINVDTGVVVNLTEDLPATFLTPDWSPDGKHLVVTRPGVAPVGLTVFDVACDAGTCTRTASRTLVDSTTADVYDPAYAPDGSKVAFTRAVGSSVPEVWTVGTDGTGLTRLSGVADGTTATSASNPSWQPVQVQAPRVVNTSPAAGAASVARSVLVSATFDQPLTSFTLTLTFRRGGGTRTVAGSVACLASCTTVQFTPDRPLSRHTTYTAQVTGTSAAGTGTRTWSFTTA